MSVEWCERNETKGKEIELEALYSLNSTLIVTFLLSIIFLILCYFIFFIQFKGPKVNRMVAGGAAPVSRKMPTMKFIILSF